MPVEASMKKPLGNADIIREGEQSNNPREAKQSNTSRKGEQASITLEGEQSNKPATPLTASSWKSYLRVAFIIVVLILIWIGLIMYKSASANNGNRHFKGQSLPCTDIFVPLAHVCLTDQIYGANRVIRGSRQSDVLSARGA